MNSNRKVRVVKKVISILFMYLYFVSIIKGQTDINDIPYNIDIKKNFKNVETVNLSRIGKELSYLPLETSPQCLIQEIDKILFSKSFIFVNDTRNRLLQFDKSGKFLRQIGSLGRGAYHEGGDLIKQVESYKELHGHYPELVQVDKIYATRENRMWLTERNIRITAVPLGRRKGKETETYYQKQKRRHEAAERNHIEGKFGQGKNGYKLNEIRARLKDTSESWVACIFFIMNLILYEKGYIFGSILEKVNIMGVRIMECIIQIRIKVFPEESYKFKRMEVEY